MTLKYRPEIDGLRAIAVLAVVLYHAEFVIVGVNPFKGGFIGVDIFFVISGYLITSIILREINENRFSLRAFYLRRARRILPALLMVMLITLPLAYIYMLPKALSEHAGASLSALGFGSNIWFWLEDSYTAEPSKLKPLLHTWTLAVEEQFYILFPLALLLIRKYQLALIIVGFLISLQLAQSHSASNPDATFFLLHTRLWELLAGAILAKLELKRTCQPFKFSAFMPWIGLALIAYALIIFEDTMRHPSYITATPVMGIVLIIWFSEKEKWSTKLLSARPLVAVGLISYSLYLWHYPIFAFARIDLGTLSNTVKLACIALSFICAALSYKFIEQPLRHIASLKVFTAYVIVATAIIALSSAYILKTEGAKYRLAAYDALFEVGDSNMPIDGQDCFSPRPALGEHCKFNRKGAKGTIIGIGDSHLAMFGPSLKIMAEDMNMNYEQLPHCVFILGTQIQKKDKILHPHYCPEKQIEYLKNHKNAIIVKASRLTWRITGKGTGGGASDQYIPAQEGASIESAIQNTNNVILAQGHTLVQIYPIPELKFSAQYNLKKLLKGNELTYQKQLSKLENHPKMQGKYTDYTQRHAQSFTALDAIDHPNYIQIHPHKILCDENRDTCATLRDGNLLYRDMNHLTDHGASLITHEIEQQLTPL